MPEEVGPLYKRATHTISNSALRDLVMDIAAKVDELNREVNAILEKLNAGIKSPRQ